MDLIPILKCLKELSLKDNKDLTEYEMREFIYYFLAANGAGRVVEVYTVKIPNMTSFYKHVQICKNYFMTFIFD